MLPRDLLEELAIPVHQANKLSDFLDLFEKWNQRINLSGATSREELEEHVEDSLHVVPHLPTSGRVLDVGSGGGFPVIVAAVCLPNTSFVALEPIHKKHAYLCTAARELSLQNFIACSERLENHAQRGYDAVMSRATFDLERWMALGLQSVAPDGVVIGFEASVQQQLQDVVRHPYLLRGKSRSLVIRSGGR